VSRALDDLDPTFRPLAMELIARITEAGIAVLIVDTLRTEGEQADNLARGVSATLNSFHLARMSPSGRGAMAIDLAPFETWNLHGPDKLQWDPADPVWAKMGAIGEALGLTWGGRWRKPVDPGHFELRPPVVPPVRA
jgi:hypothetical protein